MKAILSDLTALQMAEDLISGYTAEEEANGAFDSAVEDLARALIMTVDEFNVQLKDQNPR